MRANPASERTAQAATPAAAVETNPRTWEVSNRAGQTFVVQEPPRSTPAQAPVIPPPPTRPEMFVDNDNTSPPQSSAPARAANTYDGYDVRRQDRPPPVQTAPASQPYYHAAPNPQHAEQPPEQWHGRNTDDQWRDQTGWDTWTHNEWQNGFQ